MTLGSRLRALRSAKGMSLRQVARKVGVSASTLSRVEHGLYISDIAIIHKIAAFCNVSVDDLLGIEEPTKEQTDAYLVGLGYNLEQLRADLIALIDTLIAETKAMLARKGTL